MKHLHLALSFIRVPRLFVSLLFWPMVVGVFIALGQAVISSAYFGLVGETAKEFEQRVSSEAGESTIVREILFDSPKALPTINVCRWVDSATGEIAPRPDCHTLPHDVAVHTNDPANYDVEDFRSFFNGSTRNIHVCKSCPGDIVIEHREGGEHVSHAYGFSSLLVYALSDSRSSEKVSSHYVEAKAAIEELKDISGTVYLHPEGFKHKINLTQATKTMLLIINTAAIIIITLWLSLKGHRKVLDYFARNGALLPLVAACGKETFYASLWTITLFRVGLFLFAALPATVVVYAKVVPDETMAVFMRSTPEFILWLMGIISSLACLTLIASIAELKHRHSWVSFLYRYLPLALCLLGTAAWFYCVFTPGEVSHLVQNIITCTPIVGISPILIAPLFQIDNSLVAAHSLIASLLVMAIMRLNSRWFAAHLEEL